MIILKISVEYLIRIRRNFSSNVRLKTPRLALKVNLHDFQSFICLNVPTLEG